MKTVNNFATPERDPPKNSERTPFEALALGDAFHVQEESGDRHGIDETKRQDLRKPRGSKASREEIKKG
ncbi:MAG: hypothetical protein B9S36_03475 [Verrucomicrobiia bacterium Tous-C2TDCM]|nr:MAG: hypothetical protein B9S36_03475 [Verrucomicrobiae bacterium Tous-C2TDCM]